ncbi:MAG: DUF4398 domain-containing protein [Spirochaetaceae bacterium]|nr:DUF4398 domain-containing protein [Spirochaetaceae bacterium]
MKNYQKILSFTLVAALILACAKPPVEDMDNAAAAVTRAENDHDVSQYASNALARARDSLNSMRAEADAKRYNEAKRLAAETVALAERAIQDGRNAAIRARDEAANAISIMEAAITDADQTIENARTVRQRNVNFDEIDRDFMGVKASADLARGANSEKRYREAVDGSAMVRTQLSGITARIGEAAISVSRKK